MVDGKLEVTQEEVRGAQVIKVKGRMDKEDYPSIEKMIMRLYKDGKYKLVIDMRDLEYMNSLAWSVFIGNIKLMRDHKGDIRLCCMNNPVFDVFKQMDLDYLIKTYRTREEAVKSYKK